MYTAVSLHEFVEEEKRSDGLLDTEKLNSNYYMAAVDDMDNLYVAKCEARKDFFKFDLLPHDFDIGLNIPSYTLNEMVGWTVNEPELGLYRERYRIMGEIWDIRCWAIKVPVFLYESFSNGGIGKNLIEFVNRMACR